MEPTQDAAARKQRQAFLAEHKKWLVQKGDEIGKTAMSNSEWGSQARGIWEAARKETEPLVLLNLLRYQSARNKNWIRPENVFEPLSTAMEECRTRAEGQGEAAALDLIRLLLVYTIRSYTYHSKKKGGSS